MHMSWSTHTHSTYSYIYIYTVYIIISLYIIIYKYVLIHTPSIDDIWWYVQKWIYNDIHRCVGLKIWLIIARGAHALADVLDNTWLDYAWVFFPPVWESHLAVKRFIGTPISLIFFCFFSFADFVVTLCLYLGVTETPWNFSKLMTLMGRPPDVQSSAWLHERARYCTYNII